MKGRETVHVPAIMNPASLYFEETISSSVDVEADSVELSTLGQQDLLDVGDQRAFLIPGDLVDMS